MNPNWLLWYVATHPGDSPVQQADVPMWWLCVWFAFVLVVLTVARVVWAVGPRRYHVRRDHRVRHAGFPGPR